MKTTTMSKEQLLEVLKKNRKAHKKEFAKAMKTWKDQARDALVAAVKKADEEDFIDVSPLRELPKPQNFLASYDTVIKRLEFEVEKTVELDAQEFAAWVEDDWNWRGAFVAGTSLYNG